MNIQIRDFFMNIFVRKKISLFDIFCADICQSSSNYFFILKMRDAIVIYIKFKNFVHLLISDDPVSSFGASVMILNDNERTVAY